MVAYIYICLYYSLYLYLYLYKGIGPTGDDAHYDTSGSNGYQSRVGPALCGAFCGATSHAGRTIGSATVGATRRGCARLLSLPSYGALIMF